MTKLDHNYEEIVKVEEGDIVLDAGTAEGLFSSSILNKSRHIIAVEPNFHYFSYLQDIFKNIDKISLINKGLWNTVERRKIKLDGWSSNILSMYTESEIETDTIDNILTNLGIFHINFIKMDIEGAEIEALEEASYTLNHTNKIVVSSYHKRRDLNLKETCYVVDSILQDKGFNTIIMKDKLVHGWK